VKYESTEQAVAKLKKLQRLQSAYGHLMGVLYLDAATAAPANSWEGRSQTMETMSKITYELTADPENGELFS
jgi:Zn-dependent M32 family carboxypeptidase